MNSRRSVGLLASAMVIALACAPRFAVAMDETVASQPALAPLEDIQRLLKDGRYGDAEKAARELLAATEASKGCESVETAEVIDVLVEALWRGGTTKSGEGLELARRAITIKEKALGPEDARLVDSLTAAGNVLIASGKYAEARPVLERALSLALQAHGPDDLRVGSAHSSLGSALSEIDVNGSERHRREALRILELTAPDSIEVADALNGLANCVADRGRFAEAAEVYRRSLRIRETVFGPRHPAVAQSYHNLGYLHLEIGDYEEARTELEHALSIREETIGRKHRATITTVLKIA